MQPFDRGQVNCPHGRRSPSIYGDQASYAAAASRRPLDDVKGAPSIHPADVACLSCRGGKGHGLASVDPGCGRSHQCCSSCTDCLAEVAPIPEEAICLEQPAALLAFKLNVGHSRDLAILSASDKAVGGVSVSWR
jgi:hypothetical protein